MTTPETQIKQASKQYLDLMGIFNYAMLQGIGSYPGLPDRAIHYNGRVIYIELKAPKGKLSPNQIVFQKQCEIDGIEYHVIRSIEDLLKILEENNETN